MTGGLKCNFSKRNIGIVAPMTMQSSMAVQVMPL